MAEADKWTVVGGSKSRLKKGDLTPLPGTSSSSSYRPQTSHDDKSSFRQNTGRGRGTVPSQFSGYRRKHDNGNNNQPGNSNTPFPHPSVKQRPSSHMQENKLGSKNSVKKIIFPTLPGSTANNKANEGTVLSSIKAEPGCSNQNNNELRTSSHSNFPALTTCYDNALQTACKTKAIIKSDNAVPTSCSGTATAATAPESSKKKKKQPSKTERRKKREEKFYQALYQNKDSHIQFVTADMIRKLQNNSVPAPKPSTSKQCFPCATVDGTNEPQSFSALQFQQSFENFPCLTPDTGKEKKSHGARQFTNALDSNRQDDVAIVDTPEASSSGSMAERVKQGLSTPKSSNEPVLETPAGKEKCLSTPSSCPSKGKKSKQPMVIDVSSLIVTKKKERDSLRKLPSSSMHGKTGILKKENFKITTGNPLDSSGPGVINRGKIRQKKKKLTKLKLTVLKSRALKKILLEGKQQQNAAKMDILETTTISNPTSSTDETATSIEGKTTTTDLDLGNNSEEDVSESVVTEGEKDISVIKTEENPSPCTENVEIKHDQVLNKENTISDNDTSLKFIKLLDEISMLKIVDETFPSEIEIAVKSSMHTRKFRDYCDMYTSKDLHELVKNLLSELFRFQDRLYHTDPIKFKTKRRFVSGLKEALSYLNLNKVQLLIIAPDIEKNPEPGGLDEKLTQILTVAKGNGVPYIFSGSKYVLGRPMKLKTPVSIISILDKQNCEETFRELMEEATKLRERYHNDFAVKAKALKDLDT